jgi:hypothetical protein
LTFLLHTRPILGTRDQASGAERFAGSRLYGTGDRHVNLPNAYYDPELLKLMTDTLDAAWRDQQHYGDDIAGRAMRTAMAFQIMTAVGGGERDPKRLKLAAVNATAGRTVYC